MERADEHSKESYESVPLDVVTLLQICNVDDCALAKHSVTVLKEKVKRNLPCIEYAPINLIGRLFQSTPEK